MLLAALLLAGALPGGAPEAAAQEAAAAGNAASGSAAPPAPDLTPLPGGAEPGAAARPLAAAATGDFVRMVVVLGAVLGAIYLLFLLLKRGARVRGRGGNGGGIALLGSRSLGGSRSLHLVQVGRGVYLVGATDQALNLIAEVTDRDAIDALPAASAAGNGAGRSFSDLVAELGAAVGGGSPAPAAAAQPAAGGGAGPAPGAFLRRQQERLQRMGRPPQAEENGAAG